MRGLEAALTSRPFRTTCYADRIVQYPSSLEDVPAFMDRTLGFRLAVDTGPRRDRGSTWYYSSALAKEGSGSYQQSNSKDTYVSFRLVRDE